MNLRDYYVSLAEEERTVFINRAGLSRAYLHQLICHSKRSKRYPSPKLSRRLREASGNVVALSALRPDIWESTPAKDSGIELDPLTEGRP